MNWAAISVSVESMATETDLPPAERFEQAEEIAALVLADPQVGCPVLQLAQRGQLPGARHRDHRSSAQVADVVERQRCFMLEEDIAGLQYRRRRFFFGVRRHGQPRRGKMGLAGSERGIDFVRRHDLELDADAEFLGEGFDQVVFQADHGALVIEIVGQRPRAGDDDQIMLRRRREGQGPLHCQRRRLLAASREEEWKQHDQQGQNQRMRCFVLLSCPLRRGTEVAITAPTRNRMVG